MALNQYFSNYEYTTEEQDLIEDLVIESIEIKGMDVKYLVKTQPNLDYMYGEDLSSIFSDSKIIEMYLENVDGFGGDGELFSKFGLEISNTATFAVSKLRFHQELTSKIRPNEGDLIYIPVTNSILEITKVEDEDPFFQKGKQYVYKLKCKLFEFSHETFETADTDLNDLLNGIGTIDPETIEEPFGDNTEIQIESDSFIEFDPNNPFGSN